jgi:hypothetical protein
MLVPVFFYFFSLFLAAFKKFQKDLINNHLQSNKDSQKACQQDLLASFNFYFSPFFFDLRFARLCGEANFNFPFPKERSNLSQN